MVELNSLPLLRVRALGRLRAKAAIEKFAELVSNLRKEVALTLGKIGGKAARRILEPAIDGADPDVRKPVRIALAQINAEA